MTRPVPPHGTYARYQRHLKNGEAACDACAAAARDWLRTYRASSPDAYARELANAAARKRAAARLKAAHPGEYAALYAQEQARVFADRREARVS